MYRQGPCDSTSVGENLARRRKSRTRIRLSRLARETRSSSYSLSIDLDAILRPLRHAAKRKTCTESTAETSQLIDSAQRILERAFSLDRFFPSIPDQQFLR